MRLIRQFSQRPLTFSSLGSELFSDAFEFKQINEYIYEVYGKTETQTDTFDDKMFGGNASAEGGDEEVANDTVSQTGINIALFFKYGETGFDKKGYQSALKSYVKR